MKNLFQKKGPTNVKISAILRSLVVKCQLIFQTNERISLIINTSAREYSWILAAILLSNIKYRHLK